MTTQLELAIPHPYVFSPQRPYVTDPTKFARPDCAECGGSGWKPTEVPEVFWCTCAVEAERVSAGPLYVSFVGDVAVEEAAE